MIKFTKETLDWNFKLINKKVCKTQKLLIKITSKAQREGSQFHSNKFQEMNKWMN